MKALPFVADSFNLVWSEGAMFSVGFARRVKMWEVLIRPGGVPVVSEIPCPILVYPPRHYLDHGKVARRNTLMIRMESRDGRMLV